MWTDRHSFSKCENSDRNTAAIGQGDYHRDRARIIHSSSFRSLQSKTQVLGLGESDFYRTRLTHSLEVAQIGSGITEILRSQPELDEEILHWIPGFSLIEAICLAHDLGHPPFGHGGEVAANYVMRDHGGFEGNAQTLHILTHLGEYSEFDGLDLSRRTLLGTIKYPALYSQVNRIVQPHHTEQNSNIDIWTPPKCIYDGENNNLEWILLPFSQADKQLFLSTKEITGTHNKPLYKGFDTTIMELADDIAYGVHDLEDAIALNFIDRQQWIKALTEKLSLLPKNPITDEADFYTEKLFSGSNKTRKHAISKLVGYFMTSITIEKNNHFQHPLLQLQATMENTAYKLLCFLKDLIMSQVILRPELQALQFKGQRIIIKLFNTFADNPLRLLPSEIKEEFVQQEGDMRVICDYIASMSDISAARMYSKLFSPSTGSMFDRL